MQQKQARSIWRFIPYLTLPGLYVFIVVFTVLQSFREPGGTFFRLVGINPLAVMAAIVSESMVYEFLGGGIVWWFGIAWIWKASREGRVSSLSIGLGCVLSLASALSAVVGTYSSLSSEMHALSPVGVIQYVCIGLFCLGTVAAAGEITIALFRPEPRAPVTPAQ
jgi:hypothetical protein